jgi:hypothetical protein
MSPAQLLRLGPRFVFLQNPNDLLFRETALADRRSPRDRLNYQMEGITGSRSGLFNLIMNTNDAIETAHAIPDATIVPIHCDGWAHFTQRAEYPEQSLRALGIASRLRLLEPGVPTTIAPT